MEVVVYWFLSSLLSERYFILGPMSGVSLPSLLSLESSVSSGDTHTHTHTLQGDGSHTHSYVQA